MRHAEPFCIVLSELVFLDKIARAPSRCDCPAPRQYHTATGLAAAATDVCDPQRDPPSALNYYIVYVVYEKCRIS